MVDGQRSGDDDDVSYQVLYLYDQNQAALSWNAFLRLSVGKIQDDAVQQVMGHRIDVLLPADVTLIFWDTRQTTKC